MARENKHSQFCLAPRTFMCLGGGEEGVERLSHSPGPKLREAAVLACRCIVFLQVSSPFARAKSCLLTLYAVLWKPEFVFVCEEGDDAPVCVCVCVNLCLQVCWRCQATQA